jgi:septal ring factor EnvC (AmiA/AmiB activator)
MTQSPITVTYSLEEILGRIEGKIDALHKNVTEIKLELTTVKTQIESIDKRLAKVEGTQKNQIWTLITLLGGSLIAVGFRSFLVGNNP